MRPSEAIPEVPADVVWDRKPLFARENLDNLLSSSVLRWFGNDRAGSAASDGGGTAPEAFGPTPSDPAPEGALTEALKGERERNFLLALEENVISGLQDSTIDRIELTTGIPKDLEGLVRNLAEYYGLQPEVDEGASANSTVKMTLVRTESSRIRAVTLAQLCVADNDNKEMQAVQEGDRAADEGVGPDEGVGQGAVEDEDKAKRVSVISKTPSNKSKTPPRTPPRTPRSSTSKDQAKTTPRSNQSK